MVSARLEGRQSPFTIYHFLFAKELVMGRALAVFLWVMTGLSVWMLASGRWWFPKSISEHGPAYDQQFLITIIVVGVAFVVAQAALGYALWRFRDTGGEARA